MFVLGVAVSVAAIHAGSGHVRASQRASVVTFTDDRKPIEAIDFFGYKGLDLAAVRAALPLHVGDLFPPAKVKSSDDLKRQISEIVAHVTGHPATDVSFVCCTAKQGWMVYIGLQGGSFRTLHFDPAPAGTIRLPKEAVDLDEFLDQRWTDALIKGQSTEDDSAGYALANEPKTRKAQLALRDYAIKNETLILQVLATSSNVRDRAIAAEMVGYGRQSVEQIDALVHATLDPDDAVRNNATRALEVLARSKSDLAARIPLGPFISLMRSGTWTDHNKASLVLMGLTSRRDQGVLEQLRAQALVPLLEMGRWRSIGHANAALIVLGRIAGIDEDALNKMIDAGERDPILSKFFPNSPED
jgi:hypothetical protein